MLDQVHTIDYPVVAAIVTPDKEQHQVCAFLTRSSSQ